MTNQVTYTVDLTPENAAKIDQVNRILLGESYTTEAATSAPATSTKTEKSVPAKEETTSTGLTLDDVKKAAKVAKKEHGEDFANGVLDNFDVKAGASLGRRMSAIDEVRYEGIIAAWEAGPQVTEQTADEPEDDDFEDEDEFEDDESEVTTDAVKLAAKAYAKEVGRDEAKEIMAANGAKALSDIDKCSAKQLQAMFKAFN